MTAPYYIVPIVEKYKSLDPESEEAGLLALRIIVNIGDKQSLESILNPVHRSLISPGVDAYTPESHEKEEAPSSSMNTIDSFLDKFGSNLHPTGYLAQTNLGLPENGASKESRSQKTEERKPDNENSNADISELKKLINLKRYSEALQLIESQNLNNPQKSIYFAHQMRFIKKLIAIENYYNKTNG